MSSQVKKANSLNASELWSMIAGQSEHLPSKFSLELKCAPELSESDRAAVWDAFKTNMYNIYTRSSFGWDPPQKKAELFYPDSRFILVWERTGNTSEGRRLNAFTMFRFDMEDDERIVYCYELQVAASARRQGLGQHLMKLLVILGRASDMEKVMLTVQKFNTEARRFYESVGFAIDPTSPDFEDDGQYLIEEDYSILSRSVVQ